MKPTPEPNRRKPPRRESEIQMLDFLDFADPEPEAEATYGGWKWRGQRHK